MWDNEQLGQAKESELIWASRQHTTWPEYWAQESVSTVCFLRWDILCQAQESETIWALRCEWQNVYSWAEQGTHCEMSQTMQNLAWTGIKRVRQWREINWGSFPLKLPKEVVQCKLRFGKCHMQIFGMIKCNEIFCLFVKLHPENIFKLHLENSFKLHLENSFKLHLEL